MNAAERWELWLRNRDRQVSKVAAHPSSHYLLFHEYIKARKPPSTSWTDQDDEQLRAFCEAHRHEFRYFSTTLKKRFAGAMAKRLSRDDHSDRQLNEFHQVSPAECLRWQSISTAPAKKILPLLKQRVRTHFSVAVRGAGTSWGWEMITPIASVYTEVLFGGAYCQLAYSRTVRFTDGSASRSGVSWDEGLGVAPEWDQMTGDSFADDIELLLQFTGKFSDLLHEFGKH